MAGILEGDVIVAADGIKVSSTAELNSVKGDKGVGDTIALTVWRDGHEFEAEVVLMDMNLLFH
jgi:S1-C subfamily serine protease